MSTPTVPAALATAVAGLAADGAGVDHQRRVITALLDAGRHVDVHAVVAGVQRELQPRLGDAEADRRALAALRRLGARVLAPGHAGYPPRLHAAWPELGAPAWLFALGGTRWHGRPAVAIVGTRRPTADGLHTAGALAGAAARAGAVVVSGLARGIDQAAHRGALDAGGATVAVLGTGFGVDYPRGAAALRRAAAATGGVLTELAPGTPPRPHHFLARNRIIAGLADVTVVVEGRERSGALQTARLAAAQGRDVWAVPGSINAPASRAPLALVRDGASVVTSVDDVLAALGLSRSECGAPIPDVPGTAVPGTGAQSAHAAPAPEEALLLDLLGAVPTSLDELVARSGLDAVSVLRVVGRLRRRGLVTATPHGLERSGPGTARPAQPRPTDAHRRRAGG